MSLQECMDCNAIAVSESLKVEQFVWNVGDKAVELFAEIPVFTCANCESAYYDYRGEEIKDKVVTDYLDDLARIRGLCADTDAR